MTKRDAEVDDGTKPRARLADRRVVAIQVGQFALAGLIAFVIVGLATSIASRRIGEREAITDARSSTVFKAQGVVEPILTDDLAADSKTEITRIDRVVRRDILDASIVRVKIWNPDGKILYSDEPRLIGEHYELGADELRSIESGAIDAGVSDLSKPENRYERTSGKLLEVYLPIRTPAGKTLLFEAYYRYSLVEHIGSRLWRSFAPIALGALLMLELVQILFAWSLARRLRMRLQERELLLHRALEASEVERRQIASDLHDGAVQDLAGVAVCTLGRRETRRSERRARRREGHRRLGGVDSREHSWFAVVDRRHLPPEFRRGLFRLAPSLICSRVRERPWASCRTSISRSTARSPTRKPDCSTAPRRKAFATRSTMPTRESVSVRVAQHNGVASLELVDDGRGFDAEEAARSRSAGHFGLLALRGLVSDAGGKMEVHSVPDVGTTLRVEVPL